MALTATATTKVQADCTKLLGMKGCDVLKSSPDRPNLAYSVRAKWEGEGEGEGRSEYAQIVDLVAKHQVRVHFNWYKYNIQSISIGTSSTESCTLIRYIGL